MAILIIPSLIYLATLKSSRLTATIEKMFYLGKDIHDILETDLQQLIETSACENKTIEYKEILPTNGKEEKKEFAADVSAFANAEGGVIIYGMKEAEGLPSELVGLEVSNKDNETRRLDQLIRDCIAPKLSGVDIVPLDLENGKVVFLVNIPKSWAMPHMVSLGASRFYLRRAASRPPLEIEEIRNAFLSSGGLERKIRDFHRERVEKIRTRDIPSVFRLGAKLVLHVIPVEAFSLSTRFNFDSLLEKYRGGDTEILRPVLAKAYSDSPRHNIDGLLVERRVDEDSAIAEAYFQLFRTGIVETVAATSIAGDKKTIDTIYYETELAFAVKRALQIQQEIGVSPPVFIIATLLDVNGYVIIPDQQQHHLSTKKKIDRANIFLPDMYMEEFQEEDLFQFLRPMFDAMWNAGGWSGSMNYDQDERYNYSYKYRDF